MLNSRNIINKTVISTIKLTSFYPNDSVLINFKNGYKKEISIGNQSLNYYGDTLDMISNYSEAINSNFYLLLNTEFQFDADLKSFQVYAINEGFIRINVI